MGVFERLKTAFTRRSPTDQKEGARFEMITQRTGSFFGFRGNFYESDIIRAAIRPKARAIGKATARHVSNDYKNDGKNKPREKSQIQAVLDYPNDYMTGQMLQEKMIVQLELNHNAFAYVEREGGVVKAIYPIDCASFEIQQDASGELYLKFWMQDGRPWIAKYANVIHLRKDYATDPFVGIAPGRALTQLMDIVQKSDEGLIHAVENSGVIRWLLQYSGAYKASDLKKRAKEFAETYMATVAETGGVAAVDGSFTAQQVDVKDYVPSAIHSSQVLGRVYSFFNTNEKIVTATYTEDEWISYFESNIEPDLMQMSNEFTRRLFSPKERSYGNKVLFTSSNLTFASMSTKLQLVQFVDRGIMTPNEVREVLGYAPAEGGDTMIRRLDTAPTEGEENEN